MPLKRQVLGIDVGASEDRTFWTAFLRSLVKRGLSGVRLVISDAVEGLKQAIVTVLTGAAWQRCRVHFMRNLLATVPQAAREPERGDRPDDRRATGPRYGACAASQSSRRSTVSPSAGRRAPRKRPKTSWPTSTFRLRLSIGDSCTIPIPSSV